MKKVIYLLACVAFLGCYSCSDDDDGLKMQDISVEFAVSDAGTMIGFPVISDLICVHSRELAEPPIALNTSASAPASFATSRLCRRESATPSIQARTICPFVFAKSSP